MCDVIFSVSLVRSFVRSVIGCCRVRLYKSEKNAFGGDASHFTIIHRSRTVLISVFTISYFPPKARLECVESSFSFDFSFIAHFPHFFRLRFWLARNLLLILGANSAWRNTQSAKRYKMESVESRTIRGFIFLFNCSARRHFNSIPALRRIFR